MKLCLLLFTALLLSEAAISIDAEILQACLPEIERR
jgi:hypothetical protein